MNKRQIREIPGILEKELPEIIEDIARNQGVAPYIGHPDFLEERLYAWHQFGLMTHTKKVREVFLNELDGLLREWQVYDKVQSALELDVDSIEKRTLLEIAIPLHDLGKIVYYGDERVDRGHEIASRELLSHDFLRKRLDRLGLSDEHVRYIAGCVETHDVLGKSLRDVLKHQNNLNLEYLQEVAGMCEELGEKYKEVKTELGVFFLCDLLGKTDIRLHVEGDEEIMQSELQIEQTLKKRGLPNQLKKAIMQLPVNMKLAEIYLKCISSD